MTQHQVPQGSVPPAEPFVALDDTVQDTSADVVRRSRRRWPWLLAGLGVVVLVVAAVVTTVLVMRPDQPAPRMTQDLAVAHVQDEYPGRFTDSAKLIALFNATCHTLDEGDGSRPAAILPFLQAGLSADEATYILDMSIYSTCPRYAER